MEAVVETIARVGVGPTPLLEWSCLAIVLGYVAFRAPRAPRPRAFLVRLLALMGASWLAEDTCIRAYGFYAYAEGWSLFVDRVPLLIILIWPVVIHTAWDLAQRLTDRAEKVPLVGAVIVLADASLIEPIAVRAGLWHWTEPGFFSVPPIGVLGWGCFAWLALSVLSARASGRKGEATAQALVVLAPITAAGTHVLLLASWWGALRWANAAIPAGVLVALAWSVSALLVYSALRSRAGHRIPVHELLLRVPAATFFFVLLAMHADGAWPLVAYALAFAPPYLVLTAQSLTRPAPR